MYTAKIVSVENNKINFNVRVEIYKDGVLYDTIVVERVNPLSSVYGYIEKQIELFKIVDATDTTNIIGDIDFNLTKLSQAEQNKIDYNLLIMKRLNMNNEIAAGAFKIDDPRVTDLETQIKTAFAKL